MRSETKKKKSASSAIPWTTVLLVVFYLVLPFFDETTTGAQTFRNVAIVIVLGFAAFAIVTAFEDRSSGKKQ